MPVNPAWICRTFVLVGLLLDFAACGDDGNGGRPPQGPQTLAYALSQCTDGEAGATIRQALDVRHGDAEPVVVAAFGPLNLPTTYGVCGVWGRTRTGGSSVQVFPIQRQGVSPDGSVVIFEVTDDFSLLAQNWLPPDQEGIYVVHPDGKGLRRLGEASRARAWAPWAGVNGAFFSVSPNGHQVVFTDLDAEAPDPAVHQIWTLDVRTGERHQLTHLPRVPVPAGQLPVEYPGWLDNRTIAFAWWATNLDGTESADVYTTFTVTTDPDDPQLSPIPVIALEPGTLIPNFSITTPDPLVRALAIPGRTPVNGPGIYGDLVREAFLFDTDPSQVLQLTDYRRSDTSGRLTADGQRVVVFASADPSGTNPAHNCEFFSMDRNAADVRQLTHIGEGQNSNCDTYDGYGRGCTVSHMSIDPVTGWVTFESSCDPFGTNPYGFQVFTMRPDGTGLRQVTSARGMTLEPDGTVHVEMPGPFASPARGAL